MKETTALILKLLLILVVWVAPSDADARIVAKKDCFEAGEAIEVSFQYDTPTVHDWVAIVPPQTTLGTFPTNVVRQWLWTCGSRTCSRTGLRGSGSLTLDSQPLVEGSWKVFLVSLGTGVWDAVAETTAFELRARGQCAQNPPTPRPQPIPSPPTPAPTFSPSTLAPTRSQGLPDQVTIKTDKRSYAPNEDIIVTFEYENPRTDDWVGIYAFSTPSSGEVSSSGEFWMWVCGGQASSACANTIDNGSVVFGAGGVVETWSQTWPLSAGTYKAVLARNSAQFPYPAIASSTRFTVEAVPQPTPVTAAPVAAPVTRAPVTPAPKTAAPVARAPVTMAPTVSRQLPSSDFIKTDKLSYLRGEDIVVSFFTDNPQSRDWVGIQTAGTSGEIDDGEMWLWACGEPDPCSGLVNEAAIIFGDGQKQVRWNQNWPLGAGRYKAVLARISGPPWPIFLESEVFTVIDLAEKIDAAAADIRQLIRRDQGLGPKFVRLGFHDCVGGCDGCVDLLFSENNGLEKPISALGPVVDKHEDKTLGISRADIWALAALVGADEAQPRPVADFSLKTLGRQNCEDANNNNCFDKDGKRTQCREDRGPHRELPHADITTKDLFHFFSSEFGFGDKETVALFGAHTLGVLTRENSGFDGQDGWVREQTVLDNDYYFELVGNPDPDIPFDQQVDIAPPWFRVFEDNSDLDGIPDRNMWEAFPEGRNGQRILMLNADVALVRELDDNNMNKNTGRVSCGFIGEGRCPHAARSLDFAAEYRLDNNLWLRDFQDVFQRMLINGYGETTECFNEVCRLRS
eukprot:scaffold14067_cov172-Amphora_coffeaeformis.AAC.3